VSKPTSRLRHRLSAVAALGRHTPDGVGRSGSIGGHQVQEFASRRFAYYTRNPDPSLAVRTVWGTEDLQSKYGGKLVAAVDTSSHRYLLKSTSSGGGCASCGSTVRGGRRDFDHPAGGGPPKVFKAPWLVTVGEDGKVVQKKKWSEFPTGSRLRHAWLNLALAGQKKWAYLDAPYDKGGKVHLCVAARASPGKIASYPIETEPGAAPVCYTLFAFSPDESEGWLSQVVDFGKTTNLNQYSSPLCYASLRKIRL